jgi:hypothetical protein
MIITEGFNEVPQKVKNRLLELMQQKELKLGKRLTIKEVASGASVSERLVIRWLDREDHQSRFDEHAIVGFCTYFECGIADLLELEEVESAK